LPNKQKNPRTRNAGSPKLHTKKNFCSATNTDLQKKKNDPTTGQVRIRKNLIKLTTKKPTVAIPSRTLNVAREIRQRNHARRKYKRITENNKREMGKLRKRKYTS
jgi:hypothetical protein